MNPKPHDSVSIESPNKGKPIWIVMISRKDDIIGTIKFNDESSYKEFLDNFEILMKFSKDWGFLELKIDTEKSK